MSQLLRSHSDNWFSSFWEKVYVGGEAGARDDIYCEGFPDAHRDWRRKKISCICFATRSGEIGWLRGRFVEISSLPTCTYNFHNIMGRSHPWPTF